MLGTKSNSYQQILKDSSVKYRVGVIFLELQYLGPIVWGLTSSILSDTCTQIKMRSSYLSAR